MAALGTDRRIRLNPDLDRVALAKAYAETGRLQIFDLLSEDSADWIATALETQTPWTYSYWGEDNRPHYVPLPEIRKMSPAEQQALIQGITARSGTGYGFVHLNYRIITAIKAGEDAGHPSHHLAEFLNSPEFLDFARAITADSSVRKVDCQASLFRPGDFLGRHDDSDVPGVERIAAYTLGFTRRWRADWGGQLAFHDEFGDVAQGLVPRWNALTLFKVPVSHSVIPVAPYAQAPRISVVGWLRKDL